MLCLKHVELNGTSLLKPSVSPKLTPVEVTGEVDCNLMLPDKIKSVRNFWHVRDSLTALLY